MGGDSVVAGFGVGVWVTISAEGTTNFGDGGVMTMVFWIILVM